MRRKSQVQCLAAVGATAFIAHGVYADPVALLNSSFEDVLTDSPPNFSVDTRGSVAIQNFDSNFQLLSNVDNSSVGDPSNARLPSVSIPGWSIFQSGSGDRSDPRGFDDDFGGFDGNRYAFTNEGNDVILWSDLTSASINAGDWVTVTYSVASDTNETTSTAAWLSFDGGAPTGGFFTGQTGQGNATTVGAYGVYDGSRAGTGSGEDPSFYETFSQTLQINSVEAAAIINSGGIRVGVQALGDRGQIRIDNILLDVSPQLSNPTLLIGGAVGNGNFQDITGAAATGTNPFNDADPTNGGGNAGIRFFERGDGMVTLPGWTIDTDGLGGLDDDFEGASGSGDPYVFGNGTADADVISDKYGQGLPFTEGDVLRLTYAQARNNGTSNLDFEAFFDFDGTGFELVSVGEGAYDTSLVGGTAAAFETEVFLYTLTADDAANAQFNGIGLVLNVDNSSGDQWRLDNVSLEAFLQVPEPSTSILILGGVGLLLARRRSVNF